MTPSAATGRWRAPDRPVERPDPVGSIRLEGQVIDEHEHPIGGVTVAIGSSPVRTTTTEEDGSFAFDDLLARTYWVYAFNGGDHAGRSVRVRDDTEPVILRMRHGTTLAVRVLDGRDQSPIAGARVSTGRGLEQEVITGPDGVAELLGLSSWFNYFSVEADGFGPTGVGLRLPDDPGGRYEKTVELSPGAPVSGIVRVPGGAGQPGAPVEAMSQDGHAETVADEAGRFTFPALGAGTWVFSSPGLEFAPGRSEPVALDGATARDGIEIQLVAGRRIAGVVVDANGAPVANPQVSAIAGDRSGTTIPGDATGHFEVRGLEPGVYRLAAREGDRASTIAEADVRNADVSDVRLVVEDALIAGVVVDAAGEPVVEATVSAAPEARGVHGEDLSATTDSAGRWTIGPVSVDRYVLEAEWPGVGRENRYMDYPRTPATRGQRDVRIVLPAAGTITGTVVRAGGAPVTRYAIAMNASAFSTPEVVVSSDGRFKRTGLPAGTYRVSIVGNDFARKTTDEVVVEAGSTVDLGTIEVEAGRTVRGRVVGPDGAAVAGATVAVGAFFQQREGALGLADDPMSDALIGTRSATTGADGRFAIVGVAAKTRKPLRCLADKRGVGRSKERPLPEGDDEILLELVATGAIEVTVEGGDGLELSVSADEVDGEASAHEYAYQYAGTPIRLAGLTSGTYRVRATKEPGRRPTPAVQVELRSGETAKATVRFPTDGITLVVTASGCSIIMLEDPTQERRDAMVAMVRCDPASDEVLIDHVAPGDYRLCANDTCKDITVAPTPARQSFGVK